MWADMYLHLSVLVCLNYSGIRAVTFFSHSALPSLSCLLISPKCCVLCVLFFGIGELAGSRGAETTVRDVGE